jgi:hypothetical protein
VKNEASYQELSSNIMTLWRRLIMHTQSAVDFSAKINDDILFDSCSMSKGKENSGPVKL